MTVDGLQQGGFLGPGFQFDPGRQWKWVRGRFRDFQANIALTETQRQRGTTSATEIANALDARFWPGTNTGHTYWHGSWAKRTTVRSRDRDVDILYSVSEADMNRYRARLHNGPAALLQDIRNALLERFPGTEIAGDRQVVVVAFEHVTVEVAPGHMNGVTWSGCDSKAGGAFISSTPYREIEAIDAADAGANANARPLIRMMKVWKAEQNVDVPAVALEVLASQFIATWAYRGFDVFFYDWMIRDFLAFLSAFAPTSIQLPSGPRIELGSGWHPAISRALAHSRAACDLERDNSMVEAGERWQRIFGADIPMHTTDQAI